MPRSVISRILTIFGCAAFVLVVAAWAVPSVASASDGRTVFVDQKCNWCHTINDLGVDRPEEKRARKGGPDLSNVGTRFDPIWFQRWLSEKEKRKSMTSDAIVAHRKQIKNNPDDLRALVRFLGTLRHRNSE